MTTEPGPASPDQAVYLALFHTMVTIRRCEEQLARLYQSGLLLGGCHTYIGEEAIATGVCAHLTTADAVFSTHRGHGHALAKGVTPHELIAELYGRATGCSRGRGGSMHLFKPETGMMGTSGIVGPSMLQATGAGYSFKLRRTGNVGVAFFGDGAVNNGAFHEGLNLASIYQLPTLFVCENNMYATEVPFAYATRNTHVAERGVAYGIPAFAVDGNDVMAVYEAAGEAIRRARAGGGPTLLECLTYRTRPHSEGMRDGGYRSFEEIAEWKARDPLKLFRAQLVSTGLVDEATLDRIETEIQATIEEATEFAKNSPWPDPATALNHVYAA